MSNSDDTELDKLNAEIDQRIKLAEIACDEKRLGDATEHIAAAFEIHRALRRLERAIWVSAMTKLREAGVVITSGGSA